MMDQSAVLEVMKDLAVRAGEIIIKIYRTDFKVEYKADESPLTAADRESNALIVSELRQTFPEYAILSEELADDKSRRQNDYCFIVDPLDGTKEFVNRRGEFTVNIALAYRGTPIIGVIYQPLYRQLYYASTEQGAYRHSLRENVKMKIHVSDRLEKLIWIGSKSHAMEEENILAAAHYVQIARRIAAGSSMKGCLVAEGRADVYYRFGPTCEWDTAAMQCIAECAGAVVRQMDGTPLTYNRENTLNDKGFYIVNRPENVWV